MLIQGRFNRYVARLYPDAGLAELQMITTLFTWFFLLDDECDRHASPDLDTVRRLVRGAVTLLRTGDAPTAAFDGVLRDLLVEVWREPSRRMSETSRTRVVDAVEHHLRGVLVEASNKVNGERPRLTEYMVLRRATSAAYVSFALVDVAVGIEVPPAGYQHPAVQDFSDAGNDLLSWFNDLLSLNRDIVTSGGHNLVLALARDRGLSMVAAVEAAEELWRGTMEHFCDLRRVVPILGPEVERYLDGVEYAVRGTIDWTLESPRYQQVEQAKHEKGDPHETVRREECPVDPGQVGRRDNNVLVTERQRGEPKPQPPQPAKPDQLTEPHKKPKGHHVHHGG
jgi:hypothetical protein